MIKATKPRRTSPDGNPRRATGRWCTVTSLRTTVSANLRPGTRTTRWSRSPGMVRQPSASQRAVGYPRRPNGSMLHEVPRRISIRGATPSTGPSPTTATRAARTNGTIRPIPTVSHSGRRSTACPTAPVGAARATWPAMCGNGSTVGGPMAIWRPGLRLTSTARRVAGRGMTRAGRSPWSFARA